MDRVLEFARARENWNSPDERAHVLAYLDKAREMFAEKAGEFRRLQGLRPHPRPTKPD
jgi:hypothetical protein